MNDQHTPLKQADVEVCELSPLGSSPASGTRRGSSAGIPVRVEDRLLTYGRLYAERKEQRRLEREIARRQLEAEVRAAGSAVLRSRNVNTHAAVALQTKESRAKEVERRAARQQARRAALLAAERAEETHRPAVSATSAELAAVRRRRAHLDGLSTAEALSVQQQHRDARMAELRRVEDQQRCPHAPVISAHAKGLRVSLPAPERLYALSKEQAAESERARVAALQMEAQLSSFTPRISALAQALKHKGRGEGRSGGSDVHSALYAAGRERAAAQEEQRRAAASADTFQPVINPTSRIIAQQLKESGEERRLARSSSVSSIRSAPGSSRRPRRQQRQQQQQRPATCSASAPLCRSRTDDSLPIHKRMNVWAERRNARLVATQRQIAAESEAQCTFRPRTTAYHPSPPSCPARRQIDGHWSTVGKRRESEASEDSDEDVSALLDEVSGLLRTTSHQQQQQQPPSVPREWHEDVLAPRPPHRRSTAARVQQQHGVDATTDAATARSLLEEADRISRLLCTISS